MFWQNLTCVLRVTYIMYHKIQRDFLRMFSGTLARSRKYYSETYLQGILQCLIVLLYNRCPPIAGSLTWGRRTLLWESVPWSEGVLSLDCTLKQVLLYLVYVWKNRNNKYWPIMNMLGDHTIYCLLPWLTPSSLLLSPSWSCREFYFVQIKLISYYLYSIKCNHVIFLFAQKLVHF